MVKRAVKRAPVKRPVKAAKGKAAPVAAGSALGLINRGSGTGRTRGPDAVKTVVGESLARPFLPLSGRFFEGDIGAEIARALKSRTPPAVIIAGGGDGTLAAAAQALVGSDTVMGALPLGTMNLFTRSLGFSRVLDEALAQYGEATPDAVDVGLANGKVFLHQVSLGLQPRMARLRERMGYSSRFTKMLGAARAFLILAARPRMVRVRVEADGAARKISTPMLAVTNNELGGAGDPSLPARLDQGILAAYVLEGLSFRTLFGLARDYLFDRVKDNPAVETMTAREVILTQRPSRLLKRRRKGVLASMDGEVMVLENPIRVEIRPKALKVLRAAAARSDGM